MTKHLLRNSLFIIGLLLMNAGILFGQTEKVTVPVTRRPITEIFSAIEKQQGYRFFYSDEIVGKGLEVTLPSPEMTISEILAEISKQAGLQFKNMEGKLIAVSKQPVVPHGNIRIKGKVIEAKDGAPMPGVNVLVKGTTNGVITNPEGLYEITAPSDGTIIFSFVGFVQEEQPIQGRSQIDMNLVEDIRSLDEVVVTALSINRTKSSLGYSVATVKGDDLNTSKESNMINTLAGKVAGLQISKNASGVDGSTRVILRGVASITGENRPLFVVDGIPIDASHGGGGRWGGRDEGDAVSDINPDDIESVSILKGAGAAAAYGSRGANGVILITTKKGNSRKGIGVSFSSSASMEKPLLYPQFQNTYGEGAFGTYPQSPANQGFPWGWSYGPKMMGQQVLGFAGDSVAYTPQPNNYKDFFRTGSTFINTLAIESGNETSNIRASITVQNSAGIVPLNDLNKQTINLRGFSITKHKLELDGKITYIHSASSGRPEVAEGPGNPGYYLSIMPRNMSDNYLYQHMTGNNGNESLWTSDVYTGNPYWQLYKRLNNDEKHRLQSVLSAKMDFSSKLNLLIRSGLDYTNQYFHDQTATGSPAAGVYGSIDNSMTNTLEWNSDFLLGYNNKLPELISYSASVGANYRYNMGRGINQGGNHLQINDYYAITNARAYWTGQTYSQKEVYSVYGLGSVSLKDWLYLDFTLRNDWSSTLPVANNSYFYHSENLSFLFTNALGIHSDVLTAGKLRTSFAKVGNDTDPYKLQMYYGINQTMLSYPTGNFSSTLPTFDLQPEITKSWEIGTNLNFFSSRLILDVTYYRNNSENQIMPVPLPTSSGYFSKWMNAAHLRNTGLEAQLTGNILRTSDFDWDMTLNWSKNKSLVVSLIQNQQSITLDEIWYATIQARPGQEFGQIYTADFLRDKFGRKLVDDNGFALPGDYKSMGKITPDWTGSISSHISWRGFSLSFLVDIRKGGKVYSIGKAYRALFGTSAESLTGRADWYATHTGINYGTPLPNVDPKGFIEDGIDENTGQKNAVPVDPIYRWYNNWSKEIGKEWVMDATNVRMREISLGYTIPRKLLEKTFINGLTVSLVGRNLFFFYNAMHDIDPESGYSSGNTGGGFEHCAIPTTRSLGINLKADF